MDERMPNIYSVSTNQEYSSERIKGDIDLVKLDTVFPPHGSDGEPMSLLTVPLQVTALAFAHVATHIGQMMVVRDREVLRLMTSGQELIVLINCVPVLGWATYQKLPVVRHTFFSYCQTYNGESPLETEC